MSNTRNEGKIRLGRCNVARLCLPRPGLRTGRENFNISALPEDAFGEINQVETRQRLDEVVKTGIPGFILRGRST